MNTSMNQGDQSSRHDYANQDNSQMGGKNTGSQYESENRDRLHSEHIEAGEHNHRQDETGYGRTRENETGMGKVERKAEEMKDKVNEGFDKADNKVHEWGDKVENKMDEWSGDAKSKLDEADRKMDKADKKIEKAHDKFAHGYENDGERKMEKAEKKMDKAQDKMDDAHERMTNNDRDEYRPSHESMNENRYSNDNARDYERDIREQSGSQHVDYGQNRNQSDEAQNRRTQH